MSTRYFSWGLLGCVALGICLATRAQEKPTGVSEESYADFMANEALDVKDLADGAEIQRCFFNCITPPDFSLFQPMFPPVVPFAATNFADDFLDSLVGEDKNSVVIYPLSLVLDPKTRETLVYNAEGKLIATIPADGKSRTWSEDADPTRVILRLDLLPTEDVEPYLYTEDRVAEADTSMVAKSAKTPKAGGVVMMNMMVGSTNFGISGFQHLTNGNMRLTVTNGAEVAEVFSYTMVYTSSVTTGTYVNLEGETNTTTNTVWTPVSPPFNGLESDWQCRETNLTLTNGVGIWEDSNISSNDRVRYYGLAKRADYDGDGLTDGAEKFVYHTNPGTNDTDGDTIPDGAEISMGLNPLDAADAEEDPDGDHLVNREEYELGLPINGSNEVTLVYFNPDPPAARRTLGAPEKVEYVTWDNLKAKAVSTIRHKEGYAEFTDATHPPSDPPKWYLSQEWGYQSEFDQGYDWGWFSSSRQCLKEFDPVGWPSAPTNHQCMGEGHEYLYYETYDWEEEGGYDFSYDQPNENFQYVDYWTVTYFNPYVSTTTWHTNTLDTCNLPGNDWMETFSSTEMGFSNDWSSFWDAPYYDLGWKTLTKEYTDGLLLSYTKYDLGLMPSVTNLEWGQRWARDNHRQEPYEEALPTNEIYSAYLISTNQGELQLQDLQYRWTIPTTTGTIYKFMWLEAFRPQDSETYTTYTPRSKAFHGDGNEFTSEIYQIYPSPWESEGAYGTVEPIGFLVQLECDKAENIKMGFGIDPPNTPCESVWVYPEGAAKSDQRKIDTSLTIFFSGASTPEGDPVDFDVTLYVYPEDLPGVSWAQTQGPEDSGDLLNADQPVATFHNPTKGGLYTFETSIPGVPVITSQLWLPVSGPDISVDFQREIDYLSGWIVAYESNLEVRAIAELPVEHQNNPEKMAERINGLRGIDIYGLINLGHDFDYILTSPERVQDLCGLVHEYPFEKQARDSARFVIAGTSRPYVTDFAKRNNMGFAAYARHLLNLDLEDIINTVNFLGRFTSNIGAQDDQYAQTAYAAGVALADGLSLPETMNQFGRDMQNPNCRVAKEWPGDGTEPTNCIILFTPTKNYLDKKAGR